MGRFFAWRDNLNRPRLPKLLLELGCVRSFRLLVVLNVGEVPPVGLCIVENVGEKNAAFGA